MSSVSTMAVELPVDDIAESEDNDSRLLADESDATIQPGKATFARRRVGVASACLIALGLITLWAYKGRFTSRRTWTREEFQAQMQKFGVLNPSSAANFTFPGLDGMTVGNCVVDTDEANAYFGKFLVASGKAQAACAGDAGSTDCMTDVLELFSSLGWVGDFIASSASQCGESANWVAGCSAEIMEISSALVDAARQGLEMNRSCVPQYKDAYQQTLNGQPMWDIPQCLVDVDLLAAHVTKGGILTGELGTECKDQSTAGQIGCAVDILDLFSQIGGTGAFFSAALVDCAPHPFAEEIDAMCAESITSVVSYAFEIGSDAAVLTGCATNLTTR